MRLTPRRTPDGSRGAAAAPPPLAWRHALRRHVGWLLLAKFAALALLWVLFFSPAHRVPVDGRAAGRQLALTPPDDRSRTGAPAPGESGRD